MLDEVALVHFSLEVMPIALEDDVSPFLVLGDGGGRVVDQLTSWHVDAYSVAS